MFHVHHVKQYNKYSHFNINTEREMKIVLECPCIEPTFKII